MMDKRTTLALLLMAALLIVYPAIFMRQEPGRVPQKTETPTTPAKPAEAPVPPTEAVAAPVPPKEAPAVPERTAVVETPLYRAEVASAGGRVQGWELHYRGAKPMAAPGILMSRGLLVNRPGQAPRSVGFTVSTDKVALSAGGGPGELVLTGEDGFGLRITESLVFHPDSYVVDHQLKIENRHRQPQSAEIILAWLGAVELPKDTHERFQGQHPVRTVRLVEGAVHRELLAKTSDFDGQGQWIGLESEWYLTALIPRSPGFRLSESRLSETRPDAPKPVEFSQVALRATLPALTPGQTWEGRVQSYIGPKEYDRLKAQQSDKEYKVRHILLGKEDEAKAVIAEIKKGAKFEEIAQKRSLDEGTRPRGGELDWTVPGNLEKPFADAMVKLEKGKMTETPVATRYGFHVVRVDDIVVRAEVNQRPVVPELQRALTIG